MVDEHVDVVEQDQEDEGNIDRAPRINVIPAFSSLLSNIRREPSILAERGVWSIILWLFMEALITPCVWFRDYCSEFKKGND